MLQKELTPSTNIPDTFSNGASLNISTMQCNQYLFNESLDQTWGPGLPFSDPSQLTVYWQKRNSDCQQYHAIVFQPGKSDYRKYLDAIQKKINCMNFIIDLPTEALDEARETLFDLSQFYMAQQRVINMPPLENSSQSVNQYAETELGAIYNREDFYLSED